MQTEKQMNVVNIVNFVRAVEPRDPAGDLMSSVTHEYALCTKYGFEHTFLLQYDALVREDMRDFFLARKDDPHMEIGFWFEVVKPLTDAAGLPWRGRPGWTWDWHIVPGFLMAYTQEQRMTLCDRAMEKFREVFGYYPASVGSWMLDSFSVEYMRKKYGVRGFCICREQFGVDAYTLWGGYFNQGYYPSRDNLLCPAQEERNAIDAPVFRMLGPNPIYNYGDHPFPGYEARGCPTIEPAWDGGSKEEVVDWFFDTYFNNPSLAFSYIQLGQENSFFWNEIEVGFTMQMEKLDKIVRARDDVHVMKMRDTADWFVKEYPHCASPSVALCGTTNPFPQNLQSFWYNTRRYRCNVMVRDGEVYFRDIMKYEDLYHDCWVNRVCTENTARMDALPVVDGWGWRDDDHPFPGLYLDKIDAPATVTQDKENETLTVRAGRMTVTCTPDGIVMDLPDRQPLTLDFSPAISDSIGADAGAIRMSHNAYAYSVPVRGATVKVDRAAGRITLAPTDKRVVLEMNN